MYCHVCHTFYIRIDRTVVTSYVQMNLVWTCAQELAGCGAFWFEFNGARKRLGLFSFQDYILRMKVELKSESNSQDQRCFRNKKRLKRKTFENEIGVRALTAHWLKGQTLRKLALQTNLRKHKGNHICHSFFCKSNPDPVLARTTPSLAPPIASLCAHLAQSMPLQT